MSNFSPAPWQLVEDEGSAKIMDDNGEFVTYVAQSRYYDNREDKTADANKHLIAAAPDLYAALEQAVAWMDCERTPINVLAHSRTILRRARGEA